MIKSFRILVLLCLLAGALPGRALALTTSFPLTQFLPFPSLELRCVHDEQAMDIAIPERWKINTATLNVNYTVSTSLLSHLSQMVVRLNGIPIGQARLSPLAPATLLKIALPTKLLAPGYNKLTFQVDQHRQEKECELPCATDLWTSIKLDSSSLDIDYDLRTIPLKLSSLTDMVFDPRIAPSSTVHLAFDTARRAGGQPGGGGGVRRSTSLRLPARRLHRVGHPRTGS